MNKGMSQTLTLVVIASVLMMTALTVAVLGRTTLLDSSENLNRDACVQAVEGACGLSESVPAPSQCVERSDDGSITSHVDIASYNYEDGRYICSGN
ncbi:hypothetical protein [Candidatus Nanohalococcus occultus]|uniref:Uncharacterized protein n=1 Tax=Candidatus Nanohalococcus occultus TaxID=2978047 RepID=A0ABY8CFJ8_9ARCH|nr:hypothetical protein SVXNc_1004 [Candidatus Nanohaloarchaeota archaeon SVXNc]